jgi:hypothetical protein
MSVEETTVKLVAATAPKTTLVVPVKPVPVMVTVVPPVVGPELGEMELTIGGEELKVSALPSSSTATQKLALGHDTKSPASPSTSAGDDHEDPL